MKSDKLILNILEIALIIILLCFIIFSKIFTRTIIAVILLVFMVITQKLIKGYKQKGKYNKKVTTLMIAVGIVYLALIYILGIYIGFYNAAATLSIRTIINFIIPYIVIIISIENIRKTILLKEEKQSKIILLIATVILDVSLATNIYNLDTINDYFTLISFTVFSSIANNLLYNYIILKHRNCKAIIAYRIITTLYIYIIPIIPNLHVFLESILKMVIPYIIYSILEAIYSKNEKHTTTTTKTRNIIIITILIILVTGIIMLISCKFKYGILVVGSGSMKGTINKADAVIYETIEENEKIEIGDIIVFNNSDGVKIIHRIIDKKDSGSGIRYYTKGDANTEIDDGYRQRKDIMGKVRLRIPYIGQFTIMVNDMLK